MQAEASRAEIDARTIWRHVVTFLEITQPHRTDISVSEVKRLAGQSFDAIRWFIDTWWEKISLLSHHLEPWRGPLRLYNELRDAWNSTINGWHALLEQRSQVLDASRGSGEYGTAAGAVQSPALAHAATGWENYLNQQTLQQFQVEQLPVVE